MRHAGQSLPLLKLMRDIEGIGFFFFLMGELATDTEMSIIVMKAYKIRSSSDLRFTWTRWSPSRFALVEEELWIWLPTT